MLNIINIKWKVIHGRILAVKENRKSSSEIKYIGQSQLTLKLGQDIHNYTTAENNTI
jgi:hypothetical protein